MTINSSHLRTPRDPLIDELGYRTERNQGALRKRQQFLEDKAGELAIGLIVRLVGGDRILPMRGIVGLLSERHEPTYDATTLHVRFKAYASVISADEDAQFFDLPRAQLSQRPVELEAHGTAVRSTQDSHFGVVGDRDQTFVVAGAGAASDWLYSPELFSSLGMSPGNLQTVHFMERISQELSYLQIAMDK